MNHKQSPPYQCAKSFYNRPKSGSTVIKLRTRQFFFWGGRKPKQYFIQNHQQSILSIISMATLKITISVSDYIQYSFKII